MTNYCDARFYTFDYLAVEVPHIVNIPLVKTVDRPRAVPYTREGRKTLLPFLEKRICLQHGYLYFAKVNFLFAFLPELVQCSLFLV